MPKDFWVIFQYNRWLLNHLFSLAADTLLSLAKKRGLTVGIFVALHTYGRQVNFNCHIHLSIAEFGLNRHGKLKTFAFKFGLLMKQWRYGITNLLRTHYSALILMDRNLSGSYPSRVMFAVPLAVNVDQKANLLSLNVGPKNRM
jgi:hypothetical protein